MKKLLGLLLAFITCLTLVSCDKETDGLKDGVPVVTYANWNLGTKAENNLYRRMIKKFNQERDDIQIKIIESTVSSDKWDEWLSNLAVAEKLPDVYMVNNVADVVIDQLATDITDFVTADPEWSKVNNDIKGAATYHDHVFGIPAGQYHAGFFANYDAIKPYMSAVGGGKVKEVFAPGAFTTEQFELIVKAMYDLTEDKNSVVGVNTTGDMINWLPATLDETGTLGHFVWNADAKRFEYGSEHLIEAFKIVADLSNFSFEKAIEKDKENNYFGTDNYTTAFLEGKIGFFQSGTYTNFVDNDYADYHFVAYPDATVIVISDYMVVSPMAANKQHAYEVAKYLSFGSEGIQARFDILDNLEEGAKGVELSGSPIVDDPELTDKWFSYIEIDGAKDVYEGVLTGKIRPLVEGNKSTPGFQQARFHEKTGISKEILNANVTIGEYLWYTALGRITVDEYIAEVSSNSKLINRLNGFITDAYEDIEALIK